MHKQRAIIVEKRANNIFKNNLFFKSFEPSFNPSYINYDIRKEFAKNLISDLPKKIIKSDMGYLLNQREYCISICHSFIKLKLISDEPWVNRSNYFMSSLINALFDFKEKHHLVITPHLIQFYLNPKNLFNLIKYLDRFDFFILPPSELRFVAFKQNCISAIQLLIDIYDFDNKVNCIVHKKMIDNINNF